MHPFHFGNAYTQYGGVAEWLNAPVLKTGMSETASGVQIPPPPQKKNRNSGFSCGASNCIYAVT